VTCCAPLSDSGCVNGVAADDTWTKTVEVRPGETANVDFGKLTMAEMGEAVIICPLNCGEFIETKEP